MIHDLNSPIRVMSLQLIWWADIRRWNIISTQTSEDLQWLDLYAKGDTTVVWVSMEHTGQTLTYQWNVWLAEGWHIQVVRCFLGPEARCHWRLLTSLHTHCAVPSYSRQYRSATWHRLIYNHALGHDISNDLDNHFYFKITLRSTNRLSKSLISNGTWRKYC